MIRHTVAEEGMIIRSFGNDQLAVAVFSTVSASTLRVVFGIVKLKQLWGRSVARNLLPCLFSCTELRRPVELRNLLLQVHLPDGLDIIAHPGRMSNRDRLKFVQQVHLKPVQVDRQGPTASHALPPPWQFPGKAGVPGRCNRPAPHSYRNSWFAARLP